jgi:hypothetical protein
VNRKQRATYNSFIGLVCLIFILIPLVNNKIKQAHAYFNPPMINPCPLAGCSSYNVLVEESDSFSWDEVAKLIIDEFSDLGKKITMEALQIAYCESRWEESAVNKANKNGTWDGGVFQFNSIHNYSNDKVFDARENVKLAKRMFLRNGKSWSAWSCKKVLK